MKQLIRADIEKFGIKANPFSGFSMVYVFYKIIYVYQISYLGIVFRKEYKKELPIWFQSEEVAKDFIECGANNVREISGRYFCNVPSFDDDVGIIPVNKSEFEYSFDNDDYVDWYVVRGFDSPTSCCYSYYGWSESLLSLYVKKHLKSIKEEQELKKYESKLLNESKEHIKNIHEVKQYKIQKI